MPKRARITTEDSPLRATITVSERAQKNIVRSVGVTLRQTELDMLAEFAADLNVSRNALMCWLIRHGLSELKAGTLTAETTKTVRVELKLG